MKCHCRINTTFKYTQEPSFWHKIEEKNYDVKTIYREQIVLLVAGVEKAGTFYKLLSGRQVKAFLPFLSCLLYTSDAADE